jgi:hypothetical protein
VPHPLGHVRFWHGCDAVLLSYPQYVRVQFRWAIDQLQGDARALPCDPPRGVDTTAIDGLEGVFRIAVRRDPTDPGFRGIYLREANDVTFLRFRDRGSEPYRNLGKLVRQYLAERTE